MADELNYITGLTERDRRKIFSWIGSLPEEVIMGIFQDAVKKSYQIKNELPELSGRICKYCAFILAARSSGWDSVIGKGFRVAEAKQFDDFSNLRKAAVAELITKGRTPVLRRKVLAYWGEVRELKEGGMGYPQVNVKVSIRPC